MLFEKYRKMIQKRAWDYAKRYGLLYEDIEAQGYLVYCKAVEKYDFTNSTFSTYLYIELNRLKDYCKTLKRQYSAGLINDVYNKGGSKWVDYEECLPSTYTIKDSKALLMEEARSFLSGEAYKVMEWIISYEWDKRYSHKPSKNKVMSKFGFTENKTNKIWEELRVFWLSAGKAVYN